MDWTIGNFDSLNKRDLHDLFKLRIDVFVVEQACAYNEIDGQDDLGTTVHYLGKRGDQLCCYARKLAPAGSDSVRIGRVVVAEQCRGRGDATVLLQKIISDIHSVNPQQAISLSAQTEALNLYKKLGFIETSDEYLEDDIPHIDMVLRVVE